MSLENVSVVRIYLREEGDILNRVLKLLKGHVRGVTALRGIAGIGEHGDLHTSALIDLSLELPLIVEFFEEAEKAEGLIKMLNELDGIHHILSWSATVKS
ncbi:MAG: DUF190 domain-containing protein [Chromatiales bacterium]|nr:DUF190 domain-containing protein [Chromatiales bacterium]